MLLKTRRFFYVTFVRLCKLQQRYRVGTVTRLWKLHETVRWIDV